MMFNSIAQAKIDSLLLVANEAIKKYNNDVAAGSEPPYPAWAIDLLSILDANERMVQALNEWKKYAMNNHPEEFTFFPQTVEALNRAGAL